MKILLSVFTFLFLLLFLSSVSAASDVIVLNPNSGHSNQNQINEALKNGNVYLNAGVYEVDNTIILPPNRALRGDPNAIIRVWGGSSQWFIGLKGVISCGDVVAHDNVISGFQIDGNIGNLPKGYANSRSDTDHDCEKLIILHGYSNQFASNITITNMKLYNSFSDGAYILFGDHIICSDNFISNCQHEGLYFSCLKNSVMYRNKIAGITSDAARLDNCVNCKVYDNLFFSYTGESYGAWKGGQAGLQIANAMSSHGYDASNKPQMTDRVEVTNNTFADPGRQAIWLHNYGGSVFVHDNHFKDATGLETMGIPIGDISENNPPSIEMSEKVFSSIFDIFDVEFTETGNVKQENVSVTNPNWETKGKAEAYIYLAGYDGQISYNNETYIPKPASQCAIVLTDTKNLAERPAGQTPTLTLEDLDNDSLRATLEVETKYKVKDSKSITVEGVSINIPSYKEKSVNETFVKTFSVPKVFPVMGPDDVNVTVDYQNNSLNPHTTVTVEAKDGTEGVITGASYEYNGSEAREYRLIGYLNQDKTGIKTANFKETKTWKFSDDKMSYGYQSLYIKGPFDPAKLHVTVTTPYDEFEVTKFNYKEAGDPFNRKFNPTSFVIALVLFVIIRPFIIDIRNTFGRLR